VIPITSGCPDEGPTEKAGRQIDEAAEEPHEQTVAALEQLGRELDEAVEDCEEAARTA
jgi:hypothetical protein